MVYKTDSAYPALLRGGSRRAPDGASSGHVRRPRQAPMTTIAPHFTAPVTPLQPFSRTTLNHIFYEAIDRFGPQDALRFKRDGQWLSLSYRDVELRVAQVAALLNAWGLKSGDRVALLSENRPEWAMVD